MPFFSKFVLKFQGHLRNVPYSVLTRNPSDQTDIPVFISTPCEPPPRIMAHNWLIVSWLLNGQHDTPKDDALHNWLGK